MIDLWLLARVSEICPELLETVQLALVIVLQRLCLELLVQLWPELALQTVAVESEQALEAVAESVGAVFGSQLTEVVIHLAVEVVAQEEGPESVQGIHLVRLADTELLAIGNATLSELAVQLLCESIRVKQRV